MSSKRKKSYATMSKVIMNNGSFCGCLIEPQGVSARWKETAQIGVFLLSRSLLLNHLELQSSEAKLLLPIMPIGTGHVGYAFPLLQDNICGNSCMAFPKQNTWILISFDLLKSWYPAFHFIEGPFIILQMQNGWITLHFGVRH